VTKFVKLLRQATKFDDRAGENGEAKDGSESGSSSSGEDNNEEDGSSEWQAGSPKVNIDE
jgi:hypothetical protein